MKKITKKTKIHTLVIDANLDQRVKEMEALLGQSERVVSSVVAGNFLVITTESTELEGPRNLLLEEARGNQS